MSPPQATPPQSTEPAAALADICGPDYVLTGHGVRAYQVDGALPRAVVFPASVAEVGAVLRLAQERHLAVIPWGGGTQMGLGAPPRQVDVVLGLRRLDRITAHEPADMTVTAEAGLPLAALQRTLREAGQFLPLDPPLPPRTTLGGCLATRAGGPQRWGYGALPDRLLGVTVVRPNGEITRAGGRVVKNVAGYELCRLYAGSLGTLGVIVEATLKVHPLPPARGALLVDGTPVEAAEEKLPALLTAPLEPVLLDLVGPLGAASLLPLDPGRGDGKDSEPRFVLVVGFAGTEEEVRWQLDQARETLQAAGSAAARTLEAPWPEMHSTLLDVHRLGWPELEGDGAGEPGAPGYLSCRAGLLSSQVTGFLQTVAGTAAEQDLAWQAAAHAAAGTVRVHLRRAGATSDDALAEAARHLGRWARAQGGSLIVEGAPRTVKEQVPVWGEPREDFFLMRSLKERFDPQQILNPGRWLGGL